MPFTTSFAFICYHFMDCFRLYVYNSCYSKRIFFCFKRLLWNKFSALYFCMASIFSFFQCLKNNTFTFVTPSTKSDKSRPVVTLYGPLFVLYPLRIRGLSVVTFPVKSTSQDKLTIRFHSFSF